MPPQAGAPRNDWLSAIGQSSFSKCVLETRLSVSNFSFWISSKGPPLNRRIPPLLVVIPLIFLLLGCGKKADPIAPEESIPAPVSDLQARGKEEGIYLRWSMPSKNLDGSRIGDLLWFRVFRQERALALSSCPDCPPRFEPVGEIDVEFPRGAVQIDGGTVLWWDRNVKAQNRYVYFVVAYNAYKTPSPESNRASMAWDQPPAPPEKPRVRSEDGALELSWSYPPLLAGGKEMEGSCGIQSLSADRRGTLRFLPIEPPAGPGPRVPGRGVRKRETLFLPGSGRTQFPRHADRRGGFPSRVRSPGEADTAVPAHGSDRRPAARWDRPAVERQSRDGHCRVSGVPAGVRGERITENNPRIDNGTVFCRYDRRSPKIPRIQSQSGQLGKKEKARPRKPSKSLRNAENGNGAAFSRTVGQACINGHRGSAGRGQRPDRLIEPGPRNLAA